MKALIFGVLSLLTICGCGCTEICSVYENVPISKYNDRQGPIINVHSYNLEREGELSINIEIKFECKVIILNAENVTHIGGIKLENTANHKIYTTNDYSLYENIILKISFAENIPPGSYKINFYYNSEISSPAVLSEWIVLTNFDDDHVNEKNSDSMRVWSRKGALGHGKYLVKNVERLLEASKNFIGVPYNETNYIKLDFVLVPKNPKSKHRRGDFIYVDEEIFVNEDTNAMESREKFYRTIAEIIINQAFNEYDTIPLFKYRIFETKLKEYLVSYVTDKITGQQNFVSMYVFTQRTILFQEDFINNRLRDRNIDVSFSPTAGFLARMIAHIVGERNIDLLIKDNLRKRNKIRNTDLLSELLEFSGRKSFLKKVIDDWRRTGGYPVVTIERNYQTNSAIIKQLPFTQAKKKTSSKRYWIPLDFETQGNTDFDNTADTKWFDSRIESMRIVTPPPDKWLMCNKQQFGYYRVNYDDRNWKLIADYLKSGNYQKIHVLNRAQLIDDAFVLAEFGYLNFIIAFDLAKYLKVETEYVPWATFWEKMFRLYQYSSISGSQYYEPFKNTILELSGPLERKYLSDAAVDDNDRMERLNKIAFIKWTCFYGSTLCRNYSLAKLKNWLADPVKNPLLEDIRKEILCAGIRSADKETWKKLLEKYLINKDKTVLWALMCSSKYELLHELIMLFINGQLVQSNPWYILIKIAQQSTIGLDTIIWFIDHKEDVIHRMYNDYNVDSPTGFITNHGKVTYDMKHFHDFVDSFCTVIEQFITNKQQLEKFKKILSDNLDILGSNEAADHLYFAQMKVSNSTSVFDSMKAYWEIKEN